MVSPITAESAMMNGKGIILEDWRVFVRLEVVELVLFVLLVLLVLLFDGSAQVVPEGTVPLGHDVKHCP